MKKHARQSGSLRRWMMRGSLRLRLVLLVLGIIVLALLVLQQQLTHLFEAHVERRVHDELERHMVQIISQFQRQADGRYRLTGQPSDPRFRLPYGGLYWQVNAIDGKVLARSRSLWDSELDLRGLHIDAQGLANHVLKGPQGEALFALVQRVWLDAGDGEKPYVFTIALDYAEIDKAVVEFRGELTWGLTLLALMLLTALAIQVIIGLWPLQEVRRAVADVRAGRRSRLDEEGPDELKPLLDELNALLEAQRKDVQRARARAGDLAHGLKTPLAILAAQARKVAAAGLGETADEIRRQVRNLTQHVEHELARVRIHGPRRGRMVQASIREVASEVVAMLQRLPREKVVKFNLDVADGVNVGVERNDLLEVLGNLLENAHKWARSTVVLRARMTEGGCVQICVEDDGPGVAEKDYERILRRGGRLDENVPGTGIGLAIVKEIVVDVYDGELSLYRAPLGGLGVRVELRAAEAVR